MTCGTPHRGTPVPGRRRGDVPNRAARSGPPRPAPHRPRARQPVRAAGGTRGPAPGGRPLPGPARPRGPSRRALLDRMFAITRRPPTHPGTCHRLPRRTAAPAAALLRSRPPDRRRRPRGLGEDHVRRRAGRGARRRARPAPGRPRHPRGALRAGPGGCWARSSSRCGAARARGTRRTTGPPARSVRYGSCPPHPWCSSRASARDAARCAAWLARLLWMELPQDEAWARGMRRDGAAQGAFWAGWVRAERRHFAADPSRPFADHVVRQRPEGYEVLPGPAGTPETPRSSPTVTDHPQCAELVKSGAGEVPPVPQLSLTGGPYRSYVLNVRPSRAAPAVAKPPVVPP